MQKPGVHSCAALVLAIPLLVTGCEGAPAPTTAASDAGEAGPPAQECAPIRGTAPFGVLLTGEGPARDDAGTVGASLAIYFPTGRVPGAEVVLVVRKYREGFETLRRTLDANRGLAEFSLHDSNCLAGISGALVGPEDGVVGVATENRSGDSDGVVLVTGAVKLCPGWGVPEQLVTVGPTISPFLPFTIRASRPLDLPSLATVVAADGTPLKVAESEWGARITGQLSLFTATTLDLSGLKDVLGAPLGLPKVKTKALTTIITDRTFDTAPPVGSVLGAVSIWSGKAVFGGAFRGGWDGAVALGARDGATKIRLRHRLACDTSSSASVFVKVHTRNGVVSALTAKCSETFVEDTLALFGAGPFAIVVTYPDTEPRPCHFGFSTGPVTYELDDVAFE